MRIHVRNMQFLMTEIFKSIHEENPHFVREIFVREHTRYEQGSVSGWTTLSIFQEQPTLEYAPQSS